LPFQRVRITAVNDSVELKVITLFHNFVRPF
jgi:hypothetical protein